MERSVRWTRKKPRSSTPGTRSQKDTRASTYPTREAVRRSLFGGRSPEDRSPPSLLRLGRAEHIREQAVRARHSRRQLPEPVVGGEYVRTLPVLGVEHSAGQRLLAGIVRFQYAQVARIPAVREVQPPLLHPSVEIRLGDFVGRVQQSKLRIRK